MTGYGRIGPPTGATSGGVQFSVAPEFVARKRDHQAACKRRRRLLWRSERHDFRRHLRRTRFRPVADEDRRRKRTLPHHHGVRRIDRAGVHIAYGSSRRPGDHFRDRRDVRCLDGRWPDVVDRNPATHTFRRFGDSRDSRGFDLGDKDPRLGRSRVPGLPLLAQRRFGPHIVILNAEEAASRRPLSFSAWRRGSRLRAFQQGDDMPLDFPHWHVSEVLVDLQNDPRLHVRVKRVAQVGERARRSRDDERRRAALAH